MATYDSDSSAELDDYTETSTLLGYASKVPTDDTFSQLGGHAVSLLTSSSAHSLD
jgi:pre-rRNA-processing protein TSR4